MTGALHSAGSAYECVKISHFAKPAQREAQTLETKEEDRVTDREKKRDRERQRERKRERERLQRRSRRV